MGTKKRDTFTYNLNDNRKVVYKGKGKDLEDIEKRHRDDGKKFKSITKTSPMMTDEGAKKKEEKALETFRKSHGGKNPKYNKTDTG